MHIRDFGTPVRKTARTALGMPSSRPSTPSTTDSIHQRRNGRWTRSEERRVGKECRADSEQRKAEDGIRDDLVTGVQTCALPICLHANQMKGSINEERIICPRCTYGILGRQ